ASAGPVVGTDDGGGTAGTRSAGGPAASRSAASGPAGADTTGAVVRGAVSTGVGAVSVRGAGPWEARRSSIETGPRKAAAGVAAVIHPHGEGSAWARLAARVRTIPPARTRPGQEISPRRRRPVRLSRWSSRAAMTHIRSMQTATAQDCQP